MVVRHLALQHFRNIPLAALEFSGGGTAFVGGNGQGKTNVLEALGFLTALRSFRQTDHRVLIAHGQTEAALCFHVEHERLGPTTVTLRFRPDGKDVVVDETPVTRLGDILGRFPTVLFCSQDIQLLRGSPALRRRWLDLVLAAMDSAYLDALQRYHRALAERNRLLKDRPDPAQLDAFEIPLAGAAEAIGRARTAGVAELGRLVAQGYAALAPGLEVAGLSYEADVPALDDAGFRELLAGSRERDLVLKTTMRGPHRDDLDFTLDGRSSRDFGSEGQQRSLVLALRLAQLGYFHERSGIRPVVLADDVLGELDPARRRRFWDALPPGLQVFATGTTAPDVVAAGGWQLWHVERGAFAAAAAPGPLEVNA